MNKEIKTTGLNFLVIDFATCTLHWALVNAYVILCAPFSMWGAFSAFVSLGSPFCQFLNYVQFELAKHYYLQLIFLQKKLHKIDLQELFLCLF